MEKKNVSPAVLSKYFADERNDKIDKKEHKQIYDHTGRKTYRHTNGQLDKHRKLNRWTTK